MELIIAQLKPYVHKYEKTGRDTYRQAGNIDERENTVPPEVTQGYFNVIFKHDGSVSIFFIIKYYSLLRLLTGFAIAAFIDWKLMVTNAINTDTRATNTNVPGVKLMR
jgi:hypothetical protein